MVGEVQDDVHVPEPDTAGLLKPVAAAVVVSAGKATGRKLEPRGGVEHHG